MYFDFDMGKNQILNEVACLHFPIPILNNDLTKK